MKAVVRFYEAGYVDEAPELRREEIEAADKDELVEAAKGIELPSAAEYAHIYVDDEPIIAITRDGIRDVENNEWIVEPEEDDD